MKSIITTLALAMALSASAQNELMKIELNDGTVQTLAVSDIRQITFGDEETPSAPGVYTGKVNLNIGGKWTYEADGTTIDVAVNDDGTLKVTLGQYSLTGTMMGDITLGSLTIDNIAYDEEKQAYYRNYSDDGLKRHFTAQNNGTVTMNNDYELGNTSEITLTFDGDSVTVSNNFKLGAMPFPLMSTFTGTR